jgi:hypothetical protein
MIHVRHLTAFPNDDRPTMIDGATNAVLAVTCAEFDMGQGGMTAEEVDVDEVASLITFPLGSELFVESGDPNDVLDNATEETAAQSRIWWRIMIVEAP